MAVARYITLTIVRHEYRMPSPVDHHEVGKAIEWARNDASAAGVDTSYADSVWVEAQDDEVVVCWTQP
jgi:hypothetical protein